MVVVDGAQGEGGGQVLRTSLALSLVTGRPLRIERIRARRKKPGLRPQHLACVEAARRVGSAEVEGAVLGAQTLEFRPHGVFPDSLRIDVGTAGSTSLVLQTVLPALATAQGPSRLELVGGTHNPLAPSFDFLARTYLPLLARMGPEVEARRARPGFFPRGGGRVVFAVRPAARLLPLTLIERGPLRAARARALVARLPAHVGERELRVVRSELGWGEERCVLERVDTARGPGNALVCELEFPQLTAVVCSVGARGVPAERVAQRAVEAVQRYLAAGVPVGEHLADQLLLLAALAGGGRYRTVEPTLHTRTQAELVSRFLDLRVELRALGDDVWEVEVGS
ncbi:MAG: RNA 3'-terminal phosphate cyclase [Planctomycetota bacterium]|nr:MAG: RNA 3'-terminal phosphate cyclase [Planctomycetota bacterium]